MRFWKAAAKWSTLAGIVFSVSLAVIGWRMGIFKSEETLRTFVENTGVFGELLFFIIQVVQVVIPIIPGGVSCLVGVILFGPLKGFLLNYTGICIGSMAAFAVARFYGRPILSALFKPEAIAKYDRWLSKKNRFTRWFAIAIFFPVAPDDMLCYLAGTTSMRWSTYNLIIWLGKPFSISLYSLGLTFLFERLALLLGGAN
jgi:uncharacterized membrane protein YdjX (TVP38/TMEM64 family)